jgi:AraC-like DNA-binding protein
MVVRFGQAPSEPVPEALFSPRPNWPAGGEVMSLHDLRSRVPGDVLARPQRPAFHSVLAVTGGTLRSTVDFTDHHVQPGAWLWIRPGQVLQWRDLEQVEGTLVLFQPEELDPETATLARPDHRHGPVVLPTNEEDRRALDLAALHLRREYSAFGGLPAEVHIQLLRHLLAVLVIRLVHVATRDDSAAHDPGGAYTRFRDAVEQHFPCTHRVEDYARLLGFAPRTLTRATQAVTGLGAKAFIDRRVALEAKRMLAHTDWPVARIAARLGFSSATNFGKFFAQHTGTSPGAFRRAVHSGRSPTGASETTQVVHPGS